MSVRAATPSHGRWACNWMCRCIRAAAAPPSVPWHAPNYSAVRRNLRARNCVLRQEVQILWEEIRLLRGGREETHTRMDYRELYLDRSRALLRNGSEHRIWVTR